MLPTRILLIEDVPTDAELLLRALNKANIEHETVRVDTREAFDRVLQVFAPDLIISDFTLPSFDGMTALRLAHDRLPDIPFIFVSGTINEVDAVESLKHGATDYVWKGNLLRLGPAVRRALQERTERVASRTAREALLESEARFRSVVETIGEWIWDTDPQWRVVFCNGAVQHILGVEPAALLAVDLRDLLHADDGATFIASVAGKPRPPDDRMLLTLRWRHSDGSYRWLESSAMTLRNTQGEVLGFRGSNRDVTERVRQQEQIGRLSRIHAVISGINATIVRIRDRQQLFSEACRIAVEHGRFRMAWIGTSDSARQAVRTAAHVGFSDELLAEMTFSLRVDEPEEHGLVFLALASGRAAISNDLLTDIRPKLGRQLLANGCRSAAVLPLMVGSQAVGALALCAAEPGAFTDKELELLTELAQDISFALDYLEKAEKINYFAYYDGLTGLPNRNLFLDRLNQVVAQALRNARMAAILFVDLDRFKLINDSLGHRFGDEILKSAAQRLQSCLREGDTVARLGGDEFAVILPNYESEEAIVRVMQRILETIAAPAIIDGHELFVTCSIGCSLYPRDGRSGEMLLRNADAAMYRAKEFGGANSQYYMQEMNQRSDERMSLERALRGAVEREEVFVEYQAQIDLRSRRIVGAEALLRWQHPTLGRIPPVNFIPLAEETGLIVPIGEWILNAACRQAKSWQDSGLPGVRMAVNLSTLQFRQRDLLQSIRRALETTGLDPEYLELEITESTLIRDAETVVTVLRELHSMGVKLALDDFGTGYSSLNYLKKFRVHRLKIDQSFVRDITVDPDDAAIAAAVISLGHALNMSVIAEGVESEEQRTFLNDLGCDEVQGYLFSRPVAADEFRALLESGRSNW